MPCAGHVEKEGHFTNTQRLLQWRDKALDPPGDARSELHFCYHLGKRIKAHYADSERERDWPIRNLTWDYPEHGPEREPSADAVLREINGYDLTGRARERVRAAQGGRDDGLRLLDLLRAASRTASTRRAGATPATSTRPAAGSRPSGAGPGPRTGASSTTAPPPTRTASRGRSARSYVWWDEEQEKLDGLRRARLPARHRPDSGPRPGAEGMDALPGDAPFIMMPDGKAWLFNRPAACSTRRCRRTTSRSSRRVPQRALSQRRRPTRSASP